MPTPLAIVLIVFGLVAGFVVLVVGFYLLQFLNLWLQLVLSDAGINPFRLALMHRRGLDVRRIVIARIALTKAGMSVPTSSIEMEARAGTDVLDATNGMIEADRAGKRLTWEQACTIVRSGTSIAAHLGIESGEERRRAARREELEGAIAQACTVAGSLPAPDALIGATGRVVDRLAPLGTVEIDGVVVRAISLDGAAPPGATVRVSGIDGNLISVRLVTGGDA